jgi:hypothetical protein
MGPFLPEIAEGVINRLGQLQGEPGQGGRQGRRAKPWSTGEALTARIRRIGQGTGRSAGLQHICGCGSAAPASPAPTASPATNAGALAQKRPPGCCPP